MVENDTFENYTWNIQGHLIPKLYKLRRKGKLVYGRCIVINRPFICDYEGEMRNGQACGIGIARDRSEYKLIYTGMFFNNHINGICE